MKKINSLCRYSLVAAASLAAIACGSSNNASTGTSAAPVASAERNSNNPNNPNNNNNADNTADRATGAKLNATDQTFVNKAAQGGMAEVQMGQLAQDKGTDPQVKDFGSKLVSDHTKANDQLKQIAANGNIDLPSQITPAQQAEIDKLKALNAQQFDKAFIREQISDHKKDIDEFQKEANQGSDPALKNFAQSTVPTLKEHLNMAESAAKNEQMRPSSASRRQR